MTAHDTSSRVISAVGAQPAVTATGRSDRVEIISIQAASVIDMLERRGEVHPDRSRTTEGADWVEAYRWMAGMLAAKRSVARGFDPSAGAMFWGWLDPSPDLLGELGLRIGGRQGSRLQLCTFAIEPARLLHSDFDAWDDLVNTGDPSPGWSSIFDRQTGALRQVVWSDLRAGDLVDAVSLERIAS